MLGEFLKKRPTTPTITARHNERLYPPFFKRNGTTEPEIHRLLLSLYCSVYPWHSAQEKISIVLTAPQKRSEFFLEDFEGKKKFGKFNVKPKNRNVRVGSFRQIFSARLFLIKNDRH